ncbi:hypothetical protein BEWA_006030 [Theileria equi strain WA]|uniref:Rab-GAP TBC domain-containing protein n=1 Tax=Theileria equi strain WA TaxID=1537102 RepID=L0B231_THEEQ|nr:hypothetical protein BEWA_006030 [Theileria equi strain WA]AFZ81194.1 hypothetical protein BEWA_006030 [Theileria equi strain WA]|eukprot:XP_004830860.1 hypothetical protein BEWA_006030 [Theileria equi strain WA]
MAQGFADEGGFSASPASHTSGKSTHSGSEKIKRLGTALAAQVIDIEELRSLLWLGVPDDSPLCYRADAWRLVLGYLPLNTSTRELVIDKKRKHYLETCKNHYMKGTFSETELSLLKQIRVDIPRTSPSLKIFKDSRIQALMERILFLWSVRNPASGYVQGINDLLTIFIISFIRPHVDKFTLEIEDICTLSDKTLEDIEADSFFCLSKILSQLQDNYTEHQPGVYKSLRRIGDLVKRIDVDLYNHFEEINIDFMQFPFRWMNCMLIRELPMDCSIRLWDTYIAEINNGIVPFHEYVSVAFLSVWSDKLKLMDYQHTLLFVQQLPTQDWVSDDIDCIISKA